MNLKEIIDTGIALEQKRRSPPFDEKGFSVNFDLANREYLEFLRLHGNLMLTALDNYNRWYKGNTDAK